MAEVGTIIEIETVDGQLEARIDCGFGPQVSATIAQGGGCDVYPLAGDRVLFHRTNGSEIVISAIYSEDAAVSSGEWRIFSRNAAGAVMAVIHAKADGSIDITNSAGKTVNVGSGGGFVSMAQPVDTFLTTLSAAVAPGGVAVVTPSPGASCPVAVAIYAAMTAAFGSGTSNCGSTNLKAD